jgi:predicted alpha/beta hydrolase
VEYVDRGTDRLAVHVYPQVGDGPAVLFLPAMGVPARYYRPFAAALAGHGPAVSVADLRGTGASTPPPDRGTRYGYGELTADVGALVERLDGRPVILAGHSLGGQAALLHAALHRPPKVVGLALVAVGIPYWRGGYGTRRGLGLLPFTQGIAATAAVMGYWPGWGFGGRQARGVMSDWAYSARTGRYRPVDGADPERALRDLTTPTLMISVANDRYTPERIVDFTASKLGSAPVERDHYDAERAGAPVEHFRWARAGSAIAARVAEFALSR